ncbi:MAG: hypothetical protein J6S14_13510 [Clostridia bacterium]|nr:hypothetical protein [Clostridia bacterium]
MSERIECKDCTNFIDANVREQVGICTYHMQVKRFDETCEEAERKENNT